MRVLLGENEKVRMECKITNPFHASKNGCSFELDEAGDFRHVFASVLTSLAEDGTPLCKKFKFSNEYEFKLNLNSLEARVRSGRFSSRDIRNNQIQSIEVYLASSPHKIRMIISHQLNTYFNILPDILGAGLWMSVKNFNDVYFTYSEIDNALKTHYFRPILYDDDFIEILCDWRRYILKLSKMVLKNMLSDPSAGDYENILQPKTQGRRSKLNTCNISSFIKRPPFHLRCSQKQKKICRHAEAFGIAFNSDSNTYTFSANDSACSLDWLEDALIENPTRLCVTILKILMLHYGEEKVATALEFKCKIANNGVSKFFDQVYGRKEQLHQTLCCSDLMITRSYKTTLLNLFLDVQ